MYNVLIIDDEPWSRQVVKSLGDWDAMGLQVTGEADDGDKGLGMIAETGAHIVITDMRMPGLEGAELLQAIHTQFPDVRILVMSGYDDFSYLKQAIQSRAVNYMLKPINPDELNASLLQCVTQLDAAVGTPGAGATSGLSVQLEAPLQERYLLIRKRVYACLLDLSIDAMKEAFDRLARDLDRSLSDEIGRQNMPYKLAYEYITLLEEYLASEGLALTRFVPELDERRIRIERSSIAGAVKELTSLYDHVLSAVQELRRTRSKLNIREVEAYLVRHYMEAISLDSVARAFAVSKEHLSRSYKAGTGENLSDAILRLRMEKARALIESDGLSIKRAAETAGYPDLAYFYRVFKKQFGITPGDLKRSK